MKSSIYIFIFIFNSLLVSAQSYCGFEAWQLEYFTSSKTRESLDFLKSQSWYSSYRYAKEDDAFFIFEKSFSLETGYISYYNSDNIKLILMRIPAECWAGLKKDLKVSKSQNIFFGGTSSTAKVKNPDSNEYGYIEFHTSDNNSTFNIVIYNQNFKDIINNIGNYREAINNASGDMFVSSHEQVRSSLMKSLDYLTELSRYPSLENLQNSKIINNFYDKNFSFFLPKLDDNGDFVETKSDVYTLYRHNEQVIEKLDKYITYKKSDDFDNTISFSKFNKISKQQDILKIQNRIQTLLNSNTPLVWTLNNNPIETIKCEDNYCNRKSLCYPNVYEESCRRELEYKAIVSNSIRLTLIDYKVNDITNTIFVFFNNPNNSSEPIVASIAEALYNNSISYTIID